MSNANNDSLEPNQDSSANEESSALSNIPQAEAIEEIIEAIPTPEKREQARHIFEETFVGHCVQKNKLFILEEVGCAYAR